mmetsp:Transcript_145165/g.404529  ORF Transcript_145165/g.404529 Transcript_145165/m.404529 type:complete len:385 (+) Transcript_145165:65-1219(+)
MFPSEMPDGMACSTAPEGRHPTASSASTTSCTEVASSSDNSVALRVKNTFLEFSLGQHSPLERFLRLRRARSAPDLDQARGDAAAAQALGSPGASVSDGTELSPSAQGFIGTRDDLGNSDAHGVPVLRLADILKPSMPEGTGSLGAPCSEDDLAWSVPGAGTMAGKDSCSSLRDHALKSPVSTSAGSLSTSDAEDVPQAAADFAAGLDAEHIAAHSRMAMFSEASAAPGMIAVQSMPPPTFGVLRLSDVLAQLRPGSPMGSPYDPVAAPPQPAAALAVAAPAVLRLEDALGRAQLGSPELPTVGSAGHHAGQCKPCTYVWRKAGCHNGVGCIFCHLCEPGELNRRKKALRRSERLAALSAASAAWSQRREQGRQRVPGVNAGSH